MIFYSKAQSISSQGNQWLVNRDLSIPACIECGVAADNDNIYFAYRKDGKLIGWKGRCMTDKKKYFWHYEVKEESPFFNQIRPTSSQLIITEGELDCVALSQLEACNVVSLPSGAGGAEKSIKDNAYYLTQFEEIYIAFDNDKCGEEAAAKVKKLIDPKKYRRLIFPGSKDANDWLQKENPEKEDLIKLLDNAEKLTCPEIVHWMDLPSSVYSTLEKGIPTGWENLDNVIGGFRLGEVTVITADTASGKTTWCINAMINIAKQGRAVWINSYEMANEVIYRKIASHFLGMRMKVKDFSQVQIEMMKEYQKKYPIYINPTRSKADLASIARQIELCTYVYDIKYILLDHFDYIHSTVKKKDQHERIDEAIQQLHEMAMRYQVHIFLVAHPRQYNPNQEELNMSFIKGSSGIKQYADNIFLLNRMDRKNPNDLRTQLYIAKNRLFGTEGPIYLTYDKTIDGFIQTLNLQEST